jgi:hypothetical protein
MMPDYKTTADAVAIVRELEGTGVNLSIDQVRERVGSLGTMDVAALRAVVIEVHGAAVGRSRPAMVKQLEQYVMAMRRDSLRVTGILAS